MQTTASRPRPVRVPPMPPTRAAMIAAAERELDAAYEATEAAYEDGSTFARLRWEARPHPQFAAWGNGWTRRWEPGEYEARAAEMLAAWDATHEDDRRQIESDEYAASVAYARALARFQVLTAGVVS